MKLTHTITVLELVWTIVAVFGLGFMSMLLLRAWQDLEFVLTTNANGDHELRAYVALTSVLIFAGGVLTQLAYTSVGAIAMSQQSNGGGSPTAAQMASSAIFILASVLGTTFAGIIYSRRQKVIKVVEERLASK